MLTASLNNQLKELTKNYLVISMHFSQPKVVTLTGPYMYEYVVINVTHN
jgi:hypothetical protein